MRVPSHTTLFQGRITSAMAFAMNDTSLVYAYVGVVPAHKAITVTLNYRGT